MDENRRHAPVKAGGLRNFGASFVACQSTRNEEISGRYFRRWSIPRSLRALLDGVRPECPPVGIGPCIRRRDRRPLERDRAIFLVVFTLLQAFASNCAFH